MDISWDVIEEDLEPLSVNGHHACPWCNTRGKVEFTRLVADLDNDPPALKSINDSFWDWRSRLARSVVFKPCPAFLSRILIDAIHYRQLYSCASTLLRELILYAYFHLAKTFADSSIVTTPAGIDVLTGRALWSNAAFLPLVTKIRPAAAVAVCIDCQLRMGIIGVAVVNLAHQPLTDEQIIDVGNTGTIEIACDRPDLMRGLIIRNLSPAGPSEAHVRDISVRMAYTPHTI